MQTLGLSSSPKQTSRFRELFWPDLSTDVNAQSACLTASWACFIIAAITVVLALALVGLAALVDAALFVAIGFGLRRMWRTAAVAGFVLYIAEQAAGIASGGRPGILTIFVLAILFNSVRASFAYQRFRKAAQASPLPVS